MNIAIRPTIRKVDFFQKISDAAKDTCCDFEASEIRKNPKWVSNIITSSGHSAESGTCKFCGRHGRHIDEDPLNGPYLICEDCEEKYYINAAELMKYKLDPISTSIMIQDLSGWGNTLEEIDQDTFFIGKMQLDNNSQARIYFTSCPKSSTADELHKYDNSCLISATEPEPADFNGIHVAMLSDVLKDDDNKPFINMDIINSTLGTGVGGKGVKPPRAKMTPEKKFQGLLAGALIRILIEYNSNYYTAEDRSSLLKPPSGQQICNELLDTSYYKRTRTRPASLLTRVEKALRDASHTWSHHGASDSTLFFVGLLIAQWPDLVQKGDLVKHLYQQGYDIESMFTDK